MHIHRNNPSFFLNLLEMVAGLVIASCTESVPIRGGADTYFCAKVLIVIPSFPILAVAAGKYGFLFCNVPGEFFHNILMW